MVLTSTHILCFRAEIRKIYTPVNPRGYKLHGRASMMLKLTAVFLRRTFSSERQTLPSDTGEIERYFVARNDFLRGMLLIDYDTHITNEMFLT